MRYVAVPKEITLDQVEANSFSFSAALYRQAIIPNKNKKPLRDLLKRPLRNSDLGQEVGSLYYLSHSTHYFIRTKALQAHSFLPEITPESTVPVSPKVFMQRNLRAGDVLMSKDSNIGEVVILDQDYPNCMASGAIYRLPLADKYKFYLLAFIKHDLFREQLDLLVPAGATIRHAKTLFLECLIPFPTQSDADAVIGYVEILTRAILTKEAEIRRKHALILNGIAQELADNQKPGEFKYEDPTVDDVLAIGRMDTARFTHWYQKFRYTVTNYAGNWDTLESMGYHISRGQNLQLTAIGPSHYSETPLVAGYRLVVSGDFNEYGTANYDSYLANRRKLKLIQRNDIIFSCRGHIGRSIAFCYEPGRVITNIDNVHIRNEEASVPQTIFVKLFFDYLRKQGFLAKIGITGSGADSLTIYQFQDIPFPLFPITVQERLAAIYHTPTVIYNVPALTPATFAAADATFTVAAGITELDRVAKRLRARLDEVLDAIARDIPVEVNFDFLN